MLLLLTRHRELTLHLARREITDRYLGQVFGSLWAIGHPLVLIGVYVFIFGFVFRLKVGDGRQVPFDYTTYLLAGLIPWLCLVESMSKATVAITMNANLVKQIVFPVEVLPVKGVIASLITQAISIILLLVYVLTKYHTLEWTYALLPLLMLLQSLFMIGLAYLLSSIGVYFRDLKDLVQVFCTVGVFTVPIFFLPEQIPELFRPLLYANPICYIVLCYQDALYAGRLVHGWAWIIFPTMSVGLFYLGYRIFRKLKIMFGNVL